MTPPGSGEEADLDPATVGAGGLSAAADLGQAVARAGARDPAGIVQAKIKLERASVRQHRVGAPAFGTMIDDCDVGEAAVVEARKMLPVERVLDQAIQRGAKIAGVGADLDQPAHRAGASLSSRPPDPLRSSSST
jgi:hypothetical protein